MPADVSFESASRRETVASHRLPIGIGLLIAGGLSAGLWVGIFAAARAVLG